MTGSVYPAPPARQGDWRRTWRNNPNYRHGRWCRYRLRLEWRVARAERRIRAYLAEAPKFLPFADRADWPTLPRGVLPRRLWSTAAAMLQRVRQIRRVWQMWQAKLHAGGDPTVPFPVLTVLGLMGLTLVRSP